MGKSEIDMKTSNVELDRYKIEIEALRKEVERHKSQITTIFANLSHELRTPLNGIIGFSELLNTSVVSPDDLKLFTGVIAESSNILMSILNDAHDIARIEAGKFHVDKEAFNLNDLIYELYVKYKPQAENKNLQLFLENLISEEFIIESSYAMLERILSKLIENAIKYTKQGWIKISYATEESMIEFSIEDTGIGVNESVRSNLFHSFVSEEVSKSRNVSGTGLDLTLCNGLVRLLGGTITHNPGQHQGSVFSFTINNTIRP